MKGVKSQNDYKLYFDTQTNFCEVSNIRPEDTDEKLSVTYFHTDKASHADSNYPTRCGGCRQS